MPIFPFFQYPYNRYYPRNNYNKPINNEINNVDVHDTLNNNLESNTINKSISDNCDNISSKQNKSSRYTGFGPIHFQNPFSMNNEEPII